VSLSSDAVAPSPAPDPTEDQIEKVLDDARLSNHRVEIAWKEGYENLGGYGAGCDGKRARYWIGRSAGSSPVLLGLHTRRSIWGEALSVNMIASVKVVSQHSSKGKKS
jgi:hypothetical protein